MEIKISANIGDKFSQGLQEVLSVIDHIHQSEDEEDVLVFQNDVFVTPLFILPLLVYISGCPKKIICQINNGYLDTIKFGSGGLKPDELGFNAFHHLLDKCSFKTYIPIISFPTNKEYTRERNDILSAVESLLSHQAKLQPNITTGLKYLIEENVDNIVEHSDSKRGYIFGQSYPTKNYLDICIADNGITLLGSYLKMEGNKFIDHLSAMKAANSGISTKNLPDAENRGYGIRTSKNMLVNGLSGNFVMLSGNALYLSSRGIDQFSALPEIATWQGTIVAMRIPYMNMSFNYINFVE
jgi:anti-sigma regulatory factor (Ser/Thr protein kinase)